MKNQNKGQIRIIEAFLAVFIVFSSFAVSSNLPMLQSEKKRDDLNFVGLQALIKLDSEGSLSKFIDYENWSELRDALSIVLPIGVCFNLTVYDDQTQQINTAAISTGGFSSQQIAFVEYLCSSQEAIFHIYIIHLRLAVAT